jgi:hypothetical protein
MENVTRKRFCMGVRFDSDKWVFSSRCLSMYPQQKLLNAYIGFDSWDFNVTSDARNWIEATPNLIEFEVETSLKSGHSSIWCYLSVCGVLFFLIKNIWFSANYVTDCYSCDLGWIFAPKYSTAPIVKLNFFHLKTSKVLSRDKMGKS